MCKEILSSSVSEVVSKKEILYLGLRTSEHIFEMGAGQSSVAAPNVAGSPAAAAAAVNPPSECPMHQQQQKVAPVLEPPSECPMHNKGQSSSTSSPQQPTTQGEWVSECPSNAAAAAATGATEIDPLNMMPPPNQRPAPDQPFALPTDRQKSNIPKVRRAEKRDKIL